MTYFNEAPILIEFNSGADEVILVFWDWADSPDDLRLSWTPDPLLAIDTEERSGYLIDEIYFVTVWIRRGGEAFLRLLEETNLTEPWTIQPIKNEPTTSSLLAGAIEHGRQPIRRKRP